MLSTTGRYKNLKTTKMRNLGLKILFVPGIAILLFSYMIMGPGRFVKNRTEVEYHTGADFVDPVCGDTIKHVSEELTYKYSGNAYYFDSRNCKNRFQSSPQKYLVSRNEHHLSSNAVFYGLGGITMGAMIILMLF
jgi:YHS domain-containing protein